MPVGGPAHECQGDGDSSDFGPPTTSPAKRHADCDWTADDPHRRFVSERPSRVDDVEARRDATEAGRVPDWLMRHRLLLVLLAISAVYFLYFYMQYPHRPGAASDLGWAGWGDQSHYLKEARAIRAGDLRSSQYSYPMGYPMVAAPFVNALPNDPFLPVNLAAFVAVVGLFFSTARRFVGRPIAFLAGLFLVLATTPLVMYTVEPWTSTPAVVTVAWWSYIAFARRRLDLTAIVVGALLLGWTYMSRGGGELVLLAPFGATLAWRHRRDAHFVANLGVLVGILLAVVAVNAFWTHRIFGTYTHPYLNVIANVGFEVGRIPSSLWGTVVYSGRQGDYWPPLGLQAFWLVFAPIGMARAIRHGDRLVHAGMLVSMLIGFVVVGAFYAFTAGALKFHCLHYIKLWLPSLGLYATIGLRDFIAPRGRPRTAGSDGLRLPEPDPRVREASVVG